MPKNVVLNNFEKGQIDILSKENYSQREIPRKISRSQTAVYHYVWVKHPQLKQKI